MKTLIVYYTWHNGNTKRIAEMIQKKTGADICAIETVTPYPEEYRKASDQGKRETETGFEPEIKKLPYDVKDYEDWAPITISTFHAAKTRSAWTYIRLVITKWNPGDEHGGEQYVGLRRLWIFGRPARKWIAPDLPSSDPAFVWVVPINDLTIEE